MCNIKTDSPWSSSICAIIPAAGYSSRMGFYKPLQPWDDSLILEKTIKLFKDVGITDIRVAVGYKADLLMPIIKRLGAKAVFNTSYDQGMFSSIKAVVKTLDSKTKAFFLLPGDCPLVTDKTILQLLLAYQCSKDTDVIYPVFQGKKGHPPLIFQTCYEAIIKGEPQNGLKEVLSTYARSKKYISVHDQGIKLDFDTWEDYQKALKDTFGLNPLFPSKEKCLALLTERQNEKKVLAHCRAVAKVASYLAENLNSKGARLNLGLVMAGALLHDIAKGEKDHARSGGQIVRELGYEDVARIIGSHMQLSFQNSKLDEASLVYFADKFVQEDQLVSLEDRFAYAQLKYKDFSLVEIENRFLQARLIQQEIEKIVGEKVTRLLQQLF